MSEPIEPAPSAGPTSSSSIVEPSYEEDDDFELEPAEPYTRRRLLREAGIAVGILAVGLPLVLLLAPAGRKASDEVDAGTASAPAATSNPSPASPGIGTAPLDSRPVYLATADLPDATAKQVAATVVTRAHSSATAVAASGKGWTSAQPSLGTIVVQGLPGRDLAMVVVQAGDVDASAPAGAVQAGAALVVDRLRAAITPSTSVILVGPVIQGKPTPRLLRVRDEVRAAARTKSVHFVDPIALGLRQGQPDLAARLGAAAAVYINPAGS
ncbi:MAG: hypothetical protein JWN17_84 [Frankiales bacterium]|nr:hypothetical protein [Frankiales bacterium]